MIRFPDEFDTFRGHFAEDSDCNAGSREWVAHNKVFVNAELATESTHFILEELGTIVSKSLE